MDVVIHAASFILTLDLPPPAVPGSSPLLLEYSEPLFAHMLPPSALTVVVPLSRLSDIAMFGYGIGTGPPGLGVLQTSGMVAAAIPLAALCDNMSMLMLTVTGMIRSPPLDESFGKGWRSARQRPSSSTRAYAVPWHNLSRLRRAPTSQTTGRTPPPRLPSIPREFENRSH